MGGQKQIDKAKEQRAWTAATLRIVVAGYIAYMGYRMVTAEDTTMSKTTSTIFCVIFGVLAAAFAGYTVYRLRIDMAAARITEETQESDSETDESSADSHDGV